MPSAFFPVPGAEIARPREAAIGRSFRRWNRQQRRGQLLAVLTTIQPPTQSVQTLLRHLQSVQADLIVIGDQKGPVDYPLPGVQFYSLKDQLTSDFRLAPALPTGHYVRKNLGYLIAIQQHPACIYETDDDNAPNDSWRPRSLRTQVRKIQARPWANVYRMFSDANIWPRGFPLDLIADSRAIQSDVTVADEVDAPIQQGLANLSPDVDAIWRLVLDRDFTFEQDASVWLPPQTWCPFNSQTTWWWPQAYPLLYLPSYCSFRMTDIWRSFVAQRCLWELGYGLVFHPPEVDQQRNVHNIMRDFEDEVAGYLHNRRIVQALGSLSLRSGPGEVRGNLRICYQELVRIDVIPEKELALVDAWLEDLTAIQ